MHFTYILSILIFLQPVANGSSTVDTETTLKNSVSGQTDYPAFCQRAACNDQLFCAFRRAVPVMQIVETVSLLQGLAYEKTIWKAFPQFSVHFNKICLEDTIGQPISYPFSVGICSPTTLRYVKTVGDLQAEFGDLRKLNIVEIGGGYGGLCKILHNLSGFETYTIVDLEQCLPLINKYLSCFKIENTKLISNQNIKNIIPCDLVISNFAIAEIDRKEQLVYLEKIINWAPRGFITYNFNPECGINAFTLKEFVSKVLMFHKNVKVIPETPCTGYNNFIITWNSK